MTAYTWPLALLFLGGILVAISASLREIYALWSSVFFYLGYAIDLLAVVLAIIIFRKRRKESQIL